MHLASFVASADRQPVRPVAPRPAMLWFTAGAPRWNDLAILAHSLLPGQVLRVVAAAPLSPPDNARLAALAPWRLIGHFEDRALTAFGCYGHVYYDMCLVRAT